MIKPLPLAADTPLPSRDDGLAARIAALRRAARMNARMADAEIRDENRHGERAAGFAAVAAMYYAAALDGHTFGNLPDIDEDGEE